MRLCPKCNMEKPNDNFPVNYFWCYSCLKMKPKNNITLTCTKSHKEISDNVAEYDGKYSPIIAQYEKEYENYKDPEFDEDYCDTKYVYVIYSPKYKLYKIGCTERYSIRYNQLRQHIKHDLKTILVIELNSPNSFYPHGGWIENFIKSYYKNKRVNYHSEWHNFNKKDIRELYRLFYHIYGDDIWDEQIPYLIPYRKNQFMQIG